MVRMNTLPFRLLCASYGADVCYSEEIVDMRLLECKRVLNSATHTIDWVENGKNMHSGKSLTAPPKVVFATVPDERVVLQIGTCNAGNALKVANQMHGDIRALDINMGKRLID
jgi:tRNA-dihydrouridine synthase 2